MKIQKLVMLSLSIWFIPAQSMGREESYKVALLDYCKGNENKLIKSIQESQKKTKNDIIILSTDNSIQAVIAPLRKKVILRGPGYQASEYELKEFLNIIETFKKIDERKPKSKKRCAIQ